MAKKGGTYEKEKSQNFCSMPLPVLYAPDRYSSHPAAARTSVSQTAKSSSTVTNKKTHSGKGQASNSSSGTWKTSKGRHYYYNARGKKIKGKVKIGSRYYFF